MRALITGGAGFIGSHLVENLLGNPRIASVRVADDLSTGKLGNIGAHLGRIEFIQGDLLDAQTRERSVRGVDVVFHEAALPSVPRSIDDPLASHAAGGHLALLMLESARRAGVKRFIYAGSSSAYGDTEALPKVETMAPKPLSPYAASKLAGEFYCAVFARCYAMDTVVLRYFNVFGPRQDENSAFSAVIARFCGALNSAQPLTIHGDGTQSRDFCYIDNVVQANLLAAFSPRRLGGEVLNIACGESYTLMQTVEMLNALSGEKPALKFTPVRAGDVKHSLADLTRAREILNYHPAVKFREGLARTFEWYKNRPR